MIAGYVNIPAGPMVYVIQAPDTSVPVEPTPVAAWAGQIVAVRHIA
jgi:hypothetical protein